MDMQIDVRVIDNENDMNSLEDIIREWLREHPDDRKHEKAEDFLDRIEYLRIIHRGQYETRTDIV